MEKNMREMHRTAAAQTGDCMQRRDGTLPAPPVEPGCLCLLTLHVDTNILVPSSIWGLPYYK